MTRGTDSIRRWLGTGKDSLKRLARDVAPLDEAWGAVRRVQLAADYRRRREAYAARARTLGLVYREADTAAAVRQRLASRGGVPGRRRPGDIHTFVFVPRIGWHPTLLPDLRELGPVTEFDYAALGVTPAQLAGSGGAPRRRELNVLALAALREAHRQRPVDWVFVYASGLEIEARTVRAIHDELGLPTVNMCLDDKHSWEGARVGDQRAGQIDVAAAFDLSWTSARVACEWYLVEGARPLYLPEGFDARTYRPRDVPRDIPVSFIGGAYGYRPSVVRFLRQAGVELRTFGPGWPESTWVEDVSEVLSRSVINLGMGGIGFSEDLTNVKARDFEVPGAGGGAYLTSFNPDLAQHFVVGSEILCYRTREELLELIRYYLAHPDEAEAIAGRARERSMREHRWLHRYERVCRLLGILEDGPAGTAEAA